MSYLLENGRNGKLVFMKDRGPKSKKSLKNRRKMIHHSRVINQNKNK